MLKAAAEQGRGAGGDVEPEINLSNLADNMKKFVEKTSGYEGAEFPKTENARDSINCDPNGIISAMTKMFEFDDDEGSNSSDDMDEYGSDDDLEEPAFTPAPASKRGGGDGAGEVLGIQDYMEMMDRELAGSKVGQSFEKEPAPKAPPRRKKTQQKSPAKTSPSKDAASSSSSSSSSPTTADKPTRPPRPSKAPGKSPNAAKSAPRASAFDDEDIDDLDEDEFRPVNVDMNIVKNLLESYSSQEGMAGPASNILSTMGVHIPQNKD